MKKTSTMLLIALCSFVGFAQNQSYLGKGVNQALYIIHYPNGQIITTSYLIFSSNDVDSVNVETLEESKRNHPEVNGVIHIYPKTYVKFISLKQLLPLYHVPNDKLSLPIYVSGVYITNNSETILVEKSEIRSLEVGPNQTGEQSLQISTITESVDEKIHRKNPQLIIIHVQ